VTEPSPGGKKGIKGGGLFSRGEYTIYGGENSRLGPVHKTTNPSDGKGEDKKKLSHQEEGTKKEESQR